VGFSRAKPQERVEPYRLFRTILEAVYMGFSGDKCVYAALLKERHVHLEKCVKSGLYNRTEFAKFLCNCISLSGPLSLLREP